MVEEPARPGGAADGLDDAAAVELGDQQVGSRQPGLGQSPVDLGEPFLAEAEDQLAPRPGLAQGQRLGQGGDEVVQLPGPVRARLGERLLHLVEDHDQGPVEPLLLAPPGVGQGRWGGRSGGLECREQRPQQALLRVAAAVADLDAVALQPGHEAGIQQRRLAHPRAAVQEQDRRPARLLDLLEQLADRVVPAEEDLGIAGREPGEVAERALGEVLLGKRRQAEERVAGRVGQAPVRGQLGPGAEPKFPGKATVVGRRRADAASATRSRLKKLACGAAPRTARTRPRAASKAAGMVAPAASSV